MPIYISLQVLPLSVNLGKFENIQKITVVLHTRPASQIQIVKYRTQLRRFILSPQDAKLPLFSPPLEDTISRLQRPALDLTCQSESKRFHY